MLWIGASDHHLGFPGTVSLSMKVYTTVSIDLLESLINGGFRKIFLLNAHAGNVVPGETALYDVNLRYHDALPDLWLTFASWFDLAREAVAGLEGMTQRNVVHACEWETSVMLRAHGDLVQRKAISTTRTPFKSAFYSPDFTGSSSRQRDAHDRSALTGRRARTARSCHRGQRRTHHRHRLCRSGHICARVRNLESTQATRCDRKAEALMLPASIRHLIRARSVPQAARCAEAHWSRCCAAR